MPALLPLLTTPSPRLQINLANLTLGPLALDVTSRTLTSFQNGKLKTVSLWPPNCQFLHSTFSTNAELHRQTHLYQLLPKALPHNLAKGDVFDLIKLLKNTDFDSIPAPQIYNQDLAGFFTSIDTTHFG